MKAIQTVVPPSLVAELAKAFPLRRPPLDISNRRLWADVGQQEVIDFLRRTVELQEKDLNRGLQPDVRLQR